MIGASTVRGLRELASAGLRPARGLACGRPLRVCLIVDRLGRGGLELQLVGRLGLGDRSAVAPWLVTRRPPEPLAPQPPRDVRTRQAEAGRTFSGWLAGELRRQSAELVHVHGLWLLPEVSRAARRAGGLPVVVSFHGWDEHSDHAAWWRRRLWSRAAHRCAARVAVSRAARDQLCRRLQLPTESVEIIPNGVDTDRFRPTCDRAEARRRLELPDDRPLLLCVASLQPAKGHDLLFDALRRLPRAACPRVVCVGADHCDGRIHALARRRLPHGDVRFAGCVDDPHPYYQAADVLVLPSRSEGLPNAVLEAMACGLPVIATSVGGVAEVVHQGRSGWLVAPGDPAALAEAVRAGLDHPEEARRRGLWGRRLAETHFTLRQTVRRYERLYHEVCLAGSDSTPSGP